MNLSWKAFALGSALFAALTAILGRIGVSEMSSDLATCVRTVVILLLSATLVTVRNEWVPLSQLPEFAASVPAAPAIAAR